MPKRHAASVVRAIMLLLPILLIAWPTGTLSEHAQNKANESVKRIDQAEHAETKLAGQAASALTGRLHVIADAPCVLVVNDERIRTLQADNDVLVTLPVGMQRVECVSTEKPSVRAKTAWFVEADKQEELTLSLKSSLRWKREGRTLTDTTTNLQWTAKDNGIDVNWRQAQQHCDQLGQGWRLPSTADFQRTFDRTEPGISCGTYTCKVNGGFRLSRSWFWSSESNGSWLAWTVFLFDGAQHSNHVDGDYGRRALCVRSP